MVSNMANDFAEAGRVCPEQGSRDHGFDGFAIPAGFLAAFSPGRFRDVSGDDARLDLSDAGRGETGVDLLLDSSPDLRRTAVVGGRARLVMAARGRALVRG